MRFGPRTWVYTPSQYIQFYTWHEVERQSRLQEITNDDWLQLTGQTQNDDQVCISGFRVINNFKFCQMYQHEKGIIQMTSSWLFRDLVTIYRPNTNFKLAGLLAWCSALVLSRGCPGNTCTSQIKNAAVEHLFQYVISSDFLLTSTKYSPT